MQHDPEIDDERCRLAVVTVHEGDAETIAARLQGSVTTRGNGFTAYVGGLRGQQVVVAAGKDQPGAAAGVLDAILMAHRPRLVMAAMVASGLAVPRGAVVVASEVVNEARKRLTLGTSAWRPRGAETGPVLSFARPVRTAAEKRDLAQSYGAIAVDRESFELARLCGEASVPFVALCVVADGAEDDMPGDIRFLLERKSRSAKVGAFAGTLIRHPSHLKHLWQAKTSALEAGDRLADWVVRLANDLRE